MGPREFEEKYPSVSQGTYDKAVSYYQNENKRLREALEYYADKKHYVPYCLAVGDYASDVTEDGGMIAKIALEGNSNA